MFDLDFYMFNIVYILLLVFIIGTTCYLFGWNTMWLMIIILILFSLIFIYVNFTCVYDAYLNDTHCDKRTYINIIDRTKINIPEDFNNILKKRDDIINNINLSDSELHNIDE